MTPLGDGDRMVRVIVNGSPAECGRYGAHGDVASLAAMLAYMSVGHAV